MGTVSNSAIQQNASRFCYGSIYRMKERMADQVTRTKFREMCPEFSPDGRYLAYSSKETGHQEVYVKEYPSGEKYIVSTGGGSFPAWNPNGRQLFYVGLSGKMMAVDITLRPRFSVIGKPRELFVIIRTYNVTTMPVRGYDITPDGRYFLLPQAVEPEPTPVTQIRIVQNWLQELERLGWTSR